ncbi:exosortase/archaeosortase family protein [Planctomycetota bacterium]|nr:exosortase/archaeosortase family protein [Planctomycetota bacterium]
MDNPIQTQTPKSVSLANASLIPNEFKPWAIAIAISFIALHWAFLWRMYLIARSDNNWSHALIVPVISLYYIFQHRNRLMATQARVCLWGLPFLILGIFSYIFGVNPIRNFMLQGYGMILGLFGLVLFLLGPKIMRVLWFPIFYLGFGVKVSQRIWEEIAVQLQWIAANCATVTLKFFSIFMDFEVTNSGTTISLTQNKIDPYSGMLRPFTESLNVAEACAGLRMLMAFLALGVATAFLWKRPTWQRIIMVLMTVPIAVAVNVGRVAALGLLTLINPELAKGDFHLFIGMLMLVPALGLYLLLGWIMDHIVIQEKPAEDPEETYKRQAAQLASERVPLDKINIAKLATWLVTGVISIAAASGLYLLMIGITPPALPLSGAAGLLAGALVKLCWTLLPPTFVALGIGIIAYRFLSTNSDNNIRNIKLANTAAYITGVLVVAFIGLESINAYTDSVLFKEAVPPRHQLMVVPRNLADWKLKHEDPPLSKEILSELGTKNYVSRNYENTSLGIDDPQRYVRFHSAYYTGTVDTVPHVPDRCYVAGGAQANKRGIAKLSISNMDYFKDEDIPGGTLAYSTIHKGEVRIPQTKDIPASYMIFTPANQPKGQERKATVMYFFAANGKFLATPDAVRLKGTETSDKYSYYCKIEVLVQTGDLDRAKEAAESFLSDYMPEIMACLPDWKDVKDDKWPK